MTRYDLSPLFRSTVGFDRLARLLDQMPDPGESMSTYPPYDIETLEEDHYRITMAVAGFTLDMLNIELHENMLTVTGTVPKPKETRQFLHHGIGNRNFERKFQLDDYVHVKGAHLKDGLLVIDLVREIPEEMRPRTIEINPGEPQKLLSKAKKMIEGSKSKAA
ncbi:Hsp20 family protein [Sneathiella glossodoripedis]|uniref:Hsp20 family protein n=1 Tax=Sneathiella glossodoripedis TaxID=418853 RepID=UPI00046F6C23|nr:Hsp20 family protein [Sneathiella glossodoripedis]